MIRAAAWLLVLALAACGKAEAEAEARMEAEQKAAAAEAESLAAAEIQRLIEMGYMDANGNPVEQEPVAQDEEPVPTAEDLIPWERLDTPATADLTVDWTEAKDHLDKFIAVEGTIVDTHNSGRACFLNFTTEWRGTFYLAILGSNMDDYPESPERYFLNKKVRAVGKVAMYRDRPQIVIESPQHIQVLAE